MNFLYRLYKEYIWSWFFISTCPKCGGKVTIERRLLGKYTPMLKVWSCANCGWKTREIVP